MICGRVELFSGGTALGAVQVYPAQMLRKQRGLPSAYSGVSVGATLSLLAGQDRLNEAEALWREVDGTNFFQKAPVDVWNGRYDLEPLWKRIKKEANTAAIKIPCWVGVYDYGADTYASIPLHELGTADEIADAVTCSSNQPWPIHQPRQCRTQKGGSLRWCGDGGVKHVLPLVPPGVEPTEVAAIFCSPIDRKDPLPQEDVNKGWEQGERALTALVDRVVRDDYRRLKVIASGGVVPVTVYAPKTWPGKPFDAEKKTILWRLEVVGPEMWKTGVKL
jgi:hypothetical protein